MIMSTITITITITIIIIIIIIIIPTIETLLTSLLGYLRLLRMTWEVWCSVIFLIQMRWDNQLHLWVMLWSIPQKSVKL